MVDAERDRFLAEQRTCRVATISAGGRPHVMPLWFLWDGAAFWLYSITRAQRWRDILRNPRVAVVVDAGEAYGELRGVELSGTMEAVGEQPRTGAPLAELEDVERRYAQKYFMSDAMHHDGGHAWLRMRPDRQYTWDFRKL